MLSEIRYEEAREILNNSFSCLNASKTVSADEAFGCVAAEDITSPLNLPATANAAVDGYCVSSAFLQANPNYEFKIVGTAKAGHPYDKPLVDGEVLWIFTGAIMPEGADCVMMQEYCKVSDERVTFPNVMQSGKNCRPAGENLAIGEVIIQKGERLLAPHIAQLAAAGIAQVKVMSPLRVGIISTGDELCDGLEGASQKEGQIYDSNRPLLSQLITQEGHIVVDGGIVKDDRDSLAKAYASLAKDCDMVISSGGASQGQEDHAKNALSNIGAVELFWRVAMKPGRPVGAAHIGNVPLFFLPGNPVAVYVCTKLFVLPTLAKLHHSVFTTLHTMFLATGFAIEKKPQERAEFIRVKLALTNEGDTVMLPHGRKGAGVLSSLTGADGLAELPYELGSAPEGTKLPFIKL